jgi:hypothetical protein
MNLSKKKEKKVEEPLDLYYKVNDDVLNFISHSKNGT